MNDFPETDPVRPLETASTEFFSATFPKSARLRKTPQFKRVYEAKNVASDAVLIVFVLKNDLNHCRLGLSVSRKVGNAVVRNRWKRLIREAFRTHPPKLSEGFDLIVIPQRGAPLSDLNTIDRSLRKLVPIAVKRSKRRSSKFSSEGQ